MQFIQETEHQRTLRRINACVYTLYSIAEELNDPGAVELRGDLLIAVENLIDAAVEVTDIGRSIAWQNAPIPTSEDTEY